MAWQRDDGGPRGFDGAKRVKGRKRHVMTDTLGLMLSVRVHPADVQDRDGADEVVARAKAKYPTLRKTYVDAALCRRSVSGPMRPAAALGLRPGCRDREAFGRPKRTLERPAATAVRRGRRLPHPAQAVGGGTHPRLEWQAPSNGQGSGRAARGLRSLDLVHPSLPPAAPPGAPAGFWRQFINTLLDIFYVQRCTPSNADKLVENHRCVSQTWGGLNQVLTSDAVSACLLPSVSAALRFRRPRRGSSLRSVAARRPTLPPTSYRAPQGKR
jgi:hypothetical protein